MKAFEIAELVDGELEGDGDLDIASAAAISTAEAGQIAFSTTPDHPKTNASCLIVPLAASKKNVPVIIRARDPKLAFALAAAALHPHKKHRPGIHETAAVENERSIADDAYIDAYVVIGKDSSVGSGTEILAGTKIGSDVNIGSDCLIHPNVTIRDGCTIGDRVVLHSGVVIGSDGFGFVRDDNGRYHKFPQIGSVVVEDDVEIGANTCIDRGALGVTRIGRGTKIDNLVQVGHNVDIGQDCVIAAQTGISGSVVIEDGCVIGGQVGFGDHSHIKSGAVIGSQAGVLPGKIVRPGVWWGTPIQPLDEFKRRNALLNRIEKIVEDITQLKKKLKDD
jgi:UDP-3-O-[3-hydroxymyristoyl] glucosamine N-acyltransferase